MAKSNRTLSLRVMVVPQVHAPAVAASMEGKITVLTDLEVRLGRTVASLTMALRRPPS